MVGCSLSAFVVELVFSAGNARRSVPRVCKSVQIRGLYELRERYQMSKIMSPPDPSAFASGLALPPLAKAPTGISGLDEVTEGGVPRGRPTLVCGPAGCGKTLLAMEFLIRG